MAITDDFSGLSDNADLSGSSDWDKVWFGSAQAGQISGDNRSGNIGIDYTSYPWDGGGHTALGYMRTETGFPDDQYAELEMISGSAAAIGPAVRMDDPGTTNEGDGYYIVYGGGLIRIYDVVGGQRTGISTEFLTTSFPATLRIEVADQDIEGFVDTVSQITATDAGGHTTGTPGIAAYGSTSGNPECDDFECSDVAGGSTVTGTATLTYGGTVTVTGTPNTLGTATLTYGHTLTATGTVTSTSSATLSLLATMI